MTNQDVLDQWVELELPYIRDTYEKDGIIDKPARRESFNNYVDFLAQDNHINEEQANNICLPDELEEIYYPPHKDIQFLMGYE